MLRAKKLVSPFIDKIYNRAERALEFGAAMPALTFVFDDKSSFVFSVEKAGDFLVLRSYDADNQNHKPLLVIGEYESETHTRGH